MTRLRTLRPLALVLAFGGLAALGQGCDEARKPNVVLFLCDDLGFECLGSYGGTSYRTPNLDALAETGIRFANAYATPLCTPSRVQLMTGRYGFRTGWVDNLVELGGRRSGSFDPEAETTFAHVLRSAGYATAVAGKWQLCDFERDPKHVVESGFDEYCCWTGSTDGERTPRHWSPAILQNGETRTDTEGKYGEDVFSDFLVEFMTRHADDAFFVYYPMVLVHAPFGSPPGESASAESDVDSRDGIDDPTRFPEMVAYMDGIVGKVVGAIDRLGLRENTLILFTSDNGSGLRVTSLLGDAPVRGGKGSLTEFGIHVPFIANWKGTAPAGVVLEDLIDSSDVLPTLAELAGAPLPSGVTLDGVSFAPQLLGEEGKPREWIFAQLGERKLVYDGRFMLRGDDSLVDLRRGPFGKLAASDDPAALAARARLESVRSRLQ